LWPLPVLEGHISHKRFESPLIAQSHFEDNASKQHDEYCDHSMRIRLKLKLIQFDAKAGINPPTPAGRRLVAPAPSPLTSGLPRARRGHAKNEADEAAIGRRRGVRGRPGVYRSVTLLPRNPRGSIAGQP
jgi:hypothetical protein